MQHLAEVLSIESPTTSAPRVNGRFVKREDSATPTGSSNPPPSASLADYLWLHMAGLYGHRWASSYGDDPRGAGGKQWALTLAGFNREQIDTGLDACRATGEEWPPSAPQFKTRCLGIPTFARVRADLHTRSLGFTRLVWQQLDSWAFTRAEQRDAERQLRTAYDLAIELRMAGAEFPSPVAGELTHEKPEVVPASLETVRASMAVIREALGMPVPESVPVVEVSRDVPLSAIERELAEHYAKLGEGVL